MKRGLVVLMVALAMAPTLAFGAKWVPLGPTNVGDVFSIDIESIQVSGDSRTFWYKQTFAERNKLGELSAKWQVTINCSGRDILLRYVMFYDDADNNGKVTLQEKSKRNEWTPIPPDSIFDGMRKRVCPSK